VDCEIGAHYKTKHQQSRRQRLVFYNSKRRYTSIVQRVKILTHYNIVDMFGGYICLINTIKMLTNASKMWSEVAWGHEGLA